MRKAAWIFLFFLPVLVICGFKSPQTAAAQGTIAPSIFMQSPREGQALQGVEIIEGKIRGDAFLKGKIAFSYAGAAEPTWFFIADLLPQVDDSAQTSFVIEWDTSQITDGNYDLRVVAEYGGGAAIFELIPNLRIRNHSPVETATPGPVNNESEIDFTPTTILEPTTASTPTPLAPNPAVVQSNDLYQVLKISGIGVVVLFIVGFIYWQVKNRDR